MHIQGKSKKKKYELTAGRLSDVGKGERKVGGARYNIISWRRKSLWSAVLSAADIKD